MNSETSASTCAIESDSNNSNTIDLDRNIARQPSGFDRRSSRWSGTKECRIDRVHLAEVIHVFQKHSRLHDALRGASRCFNDREKVLQNPASLSLNAFVLDSDAGGW